MNLSPLGGEMRAAGMNDVREKWRTGYETVQNATLIDPGSTVRSRGGSSQLGHPDGGFRGVSGYHPRWIGMQSKGRFRVIRVLFAVGEFRLTRPRMWGNLHIEVAKQISVCGAHPTSLLKGE